MVDERVALSARNKRVVGLRRLIGDRNERRSRGLYALEGDLFVREALASSTRVVEVFIDESARQLDDIVGRCESARTPWSLLPQGLIDGLASTSSPQPVLAVLERQPAELEAVIDHAVKAGGALLLLVELADPGNVGASIRSAVGAGLAGVVAIGSCADPWSPKAVRASAGTVRRAEVAEVDEVSVALEACLSAGVAVVATVPAAGQAPEVIELAGRPIAIAVGNESRGLSADVVQQASELLSIPLAEGIESLNAAMAATIVTFEWARQRRQAVSELA